MAGTFVKKREGDLFDASMGAFDEAEVCEAASHFHLYELSKNYNKKDLYSDNRLAIFKNVNGSKAEEKF